MFGHTKLSGMAKLMCYAKRNNAARRSRGVYRCAPQPPLTLPGSISGRVAALLDGLSAWAQSLECSLNRVNICICVLISECLCLYCVFFFLKKSTVECYYHEFQFRVAQYEFHLLKLSHRMKINKNHGTCK